MSGCCCHFERAFLKPPPQRFTEIQPVCISIDHALRVVALGHAYCMLMQVRPRKIEESY
jgi:hypothetical protein